MGENQLIRTMMKSNRLDFWFWFLSMKSSAKYAKGQARTRTRILLDGNWTKLFRLQQEGFSVCFLSELRPLIRNHNKPTSNEKEFPWLRTAFMELGETSTQGVNLEKPALVLNPPAVSSMAWKTATVSSVSHGTTRRLTTPISLDEFRRTGSTNNI